MNQPTEPVTQQGGRLASRRRSGGARRDAVLFVLPLALLLLVFVYAPMARLGYYAFTEYNGLRPPEWVGLDNFRFLIDWPDFQRAISNTLVLASWAPRLGHPAVPALGRHLRPARRQPRAGDPVPAGAAARAHRGPCVPARARGERPHQRRVPRHRARRPGPAMAVVRDLGPALAHRGHRLGDDGHRRAAVLGWPRRRCRGTTWRRRSWTAPAGISWCGHIYRPALAPVTRFWVLLLTIATVTSFFPWVLGLTQGGPGIACTTLDYQVYRSGVQTSRLGLASAIAIVGVLVVAILLAGQLVLRRLRGDDRVVSAGMRESALTRWGARIVMGVAVVAVLFPLAWVLRVATKTEEGFISRPGQPGRWVHAGQLRRGLGCGRPGWRDRRFALDHPAWRGAGDDRRAARRVRLREAAGPVPSGRAGTRRRRPHDPGRGARHPPVRPGTGSSGTWTRASGSSWSTAPSSRAGAACSSTPTSGTCRTTCWKRPPSTAPALGSPSGGRAAARPARGRGGLRAQRVPAMERAAPGAHHAAGRRRDHGHDRHRDVLDAVPDGRSADRRGDGHRGACPIFLLFIVAQRWLKAEIFGGSVKG